MLSQFLDCPIKSGNDRCGRSRATFSFKSPIELHIIPTYNYVETAEKEVQDTSCRGSGGVPQFKKIPQDWGIRGLIETIPLAPGIVASTSIVT